MMPERLHQQLEAQTIELDEAEPSILDSIVEATVKRKCGFREVEDLTARVLAISGDPKAKKGKRLLVCYCGDERCPYSRWVDA